jgi:hypothetical protein
VNWREVGSDKRKVPYTPGTRLKAAVNKPETWTTLAHCGERVGIMFTGDGLGGIDLDGCRDPVSGALAEWAKEVVRDFDSYTEISPSRTGLHIFAAGGPDALANNTLAAPGQPINGKAPQIEAYITARYFTVTGDKLPDAPEEIRAAPGAWARLVERLDNQPKGKVVASGRNAALFKLGCELRRQGKSDDDIGAAMRAANVAGNVTLHPNFADGPLDERELADILRSALKQLAFPDVTAKGGLRPTRPNTTCALELLQVQCRYDLFKLRYVVNGRELESFVGDVTDPALLWLRKLIYERFGFDPPTQTVHTAVMMKAVERRFHPVRDYLDSLIWDGVPRIDSWLTRYGEAEDSEYVRAVGALVLTAAVRRVRKPGCKFDEIMVLENPEQGTNKSQALQMMAVRKEWFTDSLPLGASAKETIEALSGHWIVEVSELQGMGKAHIEKVKAFASRNTDRARMAYDRTVSDALRQCVIIGTTNNEQYLRDRTGNRRFWPVRVGRFDLEALQRDRDQLWAEAAAREASEASIRLPEELWPAAAVEQQKRLHENPFVSVLDEALREYDEMVAGEWTPGKLMKGKIRAEDVWTILGLKPVQRSQEQIEKRSDALKQLGWERKLLRDGGQNQRTYFYVRGEAPHKLITVTLVSSGEGTPAARVGSYANEENESLPGF